MERFLKIHTLVLPLVGIAVGIVLSKNLSLSLFAGEILCLFGIAFYIALSFIGRRNSSNVIKLRHLAKYHYIWLFLLSIGLGIITVRHNAPQLPPETELQQAPSASGRVIDITSKAEYDQVVVELIDIHFRNGKRFKCKEAKAILLSTDFKSRIDDIVVFSLHALPLTPSSTSFNTGYVDALKRRGILFLSEVEEDEIRTIDHRQTLRGFSNLIRTRLETKIENTHLNRETQSFLISILLGDRDYLDSDTQQLFANAGVAHVLALSGMHIAIIAGILLWVLYPLNFMGRAKLRMVITAIALWGYALITGMSPSTIRGCVMISVATCALLAERKRSAVNSLSLAAILILLFNPDAIADLGFQLSFICVGSLLAFVETFIPFDHHKQPWSYRCATMIITTLAATFGSWILTAYHYGNFPTAFLPSNLILLPILPLYISFAVCHILLLWLGIESHLLTNCLNWGYEAITKFLDFWGSDSILHLDISVSSVALWFVGILLFATYIHLFRKNTILYVSAACCSMAILIIPFTHPAVKDKSYIITNFKNKLEVVTMHNSQERRLEIPQKAVSGLRIGNHCIIFIDCSVDNATLYALDNKLRSKNLHKKIVLADGCRKDDLKLICNRYRNAHILLHPSIHHKREPLYTDSLRKLGVTPHSLRKSPCYVLANSID